jgi:hypothetical protein
MLKPREPLPSTPFAYSLRKVWRSSRVSDWRAERTWPNWTGAAVCDGGIVEPDFRSGEFAVPGWRSTK